jgi:hypothetical protein
MGDLLFINQFSFRHCNQRGGRLAAYLPNPITERDIQTMTTNPKQHAVREVEYYAPSFLDKFMDFIERLPVPYWSTYLLLFIAQSAVMHVFAWVDGWLPVFTSNPLIFLFPLWQWLPLAIMTYSRTVSRQALSTFSPLLDAEENELKRLKYEFSTMPSRGVILNGVVWGIVYVILTYATFDTFYVSYGLGTLLSVVLMLEGLITYMTGGAIYYYSFRQLSLVNRTVRMAKQFNLFRLGPVYAFSRVTSLIGISWMLMLSLTLLVFPIQLVSGLTLVILALQVVLAVAAFVLPLWFVHLRLEDEKFRLLEELNQQFESTSEKLHRCLENNDMGPVTQLKDAMLGLTAESEVLNGLPTWPWQTGVLTGFLSATILPIVLFISQLAIEKFLVK